jgi:hypothetical protein
MFRITCIAALCAAVTSAHAAAPLEHFGMCDASAAVAIGADRFLVANNDDNKLRLYRSDRSGPALKEFDMADVLRLPGVKKKKNEDKEDEADLEGAAQIGQRIYWIGSHGLNKDGELKLERRQLFATDLGEKNGAVSVTSVGKPYTRLLEAMAAHPPMKKYTLLDAAAIASETEGGLNIEGLAATPEGHLLIGFRGPVHDGKALLLPLLNPAELVVATGMPGTPKFGAPIEFALDGRGIRSIEYAPLLRAYLIVAGPQGSDGDFKLYKWSGVPTAAPVSLPIDIGADLGPEALFALPDGKTFQLLSDDGDVEMGDKRCKKFKPKERRKFRSITVTIK